VKNSTWTIPDDGEIREILADRIDARRDGMGAVAGIIDEHGQRVVAHGAMSSTDDRVPDGDTVFEIGSITKAFTALALADMVIRGEVTLDDPVVKYLPAGVSMPARGGRQITLIDLATHTSGLPRRPGNMTLSDWSNPYADYTVEQLHGFLSGYRLRRNIGETHAYSNLGFGLLGHVLSLRAGVSYETLIRERITGPLGMANTAITLSADMRKRMAVGHDQTLAPVANWDFQALAGAGALRSSANDLLAFLAAELGYLKTPLKSAMAAQLDPRRPAARGDLQALGWVISTDPSGDTVWHGGATGGYRCFVVFDRERRRGVVLLTNCASTGYDDVPFHLLTGRARAAPSGERVRAALGAEALERFAGRYRFSPEASLVVTRRGARLFAQLTGQGPFEVFPESPTRVFWRVVDAQATFEIGPDGGVTGLVLHQNGRDLPARRED